MDTSQKLKIIPLAMTMATFLTVSYVFCILFGLAIQGPGMQLLLPMLLPGFEWLSLQSFFIGLIWVIAFGAYIAVLFVPIFNYFNRKNLAV